MPQTFSASGTNYYGRYTWRGASHYAMYTFRSKGQTLTWLPLQHIVYKSFEEGNICDRMHGKYLPCILSPD
ncbi:MAG: hypothetical protein NVS2B2_30940 [Ktedonobacteraceae bacterium]